MIEVVNYYLNEMTEAILGAGGTLIAYMGDGIMAVFGAPLEQDDHADRALAAAAGDDRRRASTRSTRGSPSRATSTGSRWASGLNSGPVMAGNVGSEQRVEYTALGDTTNTASRLEGMTKGSGHMLFIADSTRERMKQPPDEPRARRRARGPRPRRSLCPCGRSPTPISATGPGSARRRSGVSHMTVDSSRPVAHNAHRMRHESSITSLSWIPSEAIEGSQRRPELSRLRIPLLRRAGLDPRARHRLRPLRRPHLVPGAGA